MLIPNDKQSLVISDLLPKFKILLSSNHNLDKLFSITKSGTIRQSIMPCIPKFIRQWWYFESRNIQPIWTPRFNTSDGLKALIASIDIDILKKQYINKHQILINSKKAARKLQLMTTQYIDENKSILEIPDSLVNKILKRTPALIEYFKDQTEDWQLCAVTKSPCQIKKILHPTNKVLIYVIKSSVSASGYIRACHMTDDLRQLALEFHKGSSAPYVKGLTTKHKMLAISLNKNVITKLRGITPEMKNLHEMVWIL